MAGESFGDEDEEVLALLGGLELAGGGLSGEINSSNLVCFGIFLQVVLGVGEDDGVGVGGKGDSVKGLG